MELEKSNYFKIKNNFSNKIINTSKNSFRNILILLIFSIFVFYTKKNLYVIDNKFIVFSIGLLILLLLLLFSISKIFQNISKTIFSISFEQKNIYFETFEQKFIFNLIKIPSIKKSLKKDDYLIIKEKYPIKDNTIKNDAIIIKINNNKYYLIPEFFDPGLEDILLQYSNSPYNKKEEKEQNRNKK